MIQNRYLVVQPIGKGGMGEVYLAVDQRLGSAVALKRTFFNEDEALGNAFEREARILARLRHPVLPKVIDHFMENGDQYLVMEHIPGDDLAKRLENASKPFPLSWVMFWADQMLDALNYLHSHEPPIVHRDIKPQNLKLTDDNHIVLLDFGLSKDFDTKTDSLNSASVAGYSPHFASMEQIRGTGTDARSDIYSLSATLYQLLANQAPADALTRADALLGGIKDPIAPLNELNPEVPAAVSAILIKGVAIRQNERYTSATEMQKELRRAYNGGATDNVVPAIAVEPSPSTAIPLGITAPPARFDAPLITHSPRAEDETRIAPAPPVLEETRQATAAPHMQGIASEALPLPVSRAASAGAGAVVASAPETVPPPVAADSTFHKKSSKTGLLIGGLIGILVLGAVVIAGGLFAYSRYADTTTIPSASPSPATQPSAPQTRPAADVPVPAPPSKAAVESPAADTSLPRSAEIETRTAATPASKPVGAQKPVGKPAPKKSQSSGPVIEQ
ncbi:MAG: protein kinase [Pyrinomonadaceae bacterium]